MMEKAMITALIGTFTSLGYVGIADQADEVIQEATVVAAGLQERELTLALEMYYLEHGSYPTASGDTLSLKLHDAGMLKEAAVPFEVQYKKLKNGRDYQLFVR